MGEGEEYHRRYKGTHKKERPKSGDRDRGDEDFEVRMEKGKRKRSNKKGQHEENAWIPPPPIGLSRNTMSLHVEIPLRNDTLSVFEDSPSTIQNFSDFDRKKSLGNTFKANYNNDKFGRGLSVLDLFCVDSSKGSERDSARSRKKRRADTRSSKRLNKEEDSTVHYDSLRFGVDSIKLVPQGLVDRMDPNWSCDFISNIVISHVENWTRHASFDERFHQEIVTLLTAYYPCYYPTILDEVLVGFMLKRPELMDPLLNTMIEKFHKGGETVLSSKFPVAGAFAQRCIPIASHGTEKKRHDFSCINLLRYLMEKNTEKFILSFWIAECASYSSDEVLDLFFSVLLNALIPMKPEEATTNNDRWDILDPIEQLYELVLYDKSKIKNGTDYVPRICMAITRRVFFSSTEDREYFLRLPVVEEALSTYFSNPNVIHTHRMLTKWMERPYENVEKKLKELMELLAVTTRCMQVTSKDKKINASWLIHHILRFFLLAETNSLSSMVLQSIMTKQLVIVLGLQEDFAKYSYATDEIQDNIKKLLSSLRDVPLKKAKWCLGTLFDSVKSMVNSLEVFLRVAFEGETIDDQEEDNLMKAFRAYTMQFCLDYFQVNTWNERLSNEIINVIEMLIRSQSCFEERLAVLEQLFRHLSSINDQSTGIISSVVINSLAKNELQTISSSQAEVPFAATNDLEVVQILLKLMHSDDTNVGSLIAQELSKVNTVHVVLGLLQQGRASSQLKIDVLQLVALVIEKSFNNVEWIRDYTLSLFVQCLMEFSSSVSTQASIVLEILLDANPICGKKLVWILLGHGIKTCNDSTLYYEKNMWKTAACVANFIKYILDLCENMVDPVVKFLEEKLFFRKHGSTFINPFVLVVIKNLTQVKLSPRCINMFQLAIFPLNHDISNQERAFICTLQLEILKALCYLVRQSAPENELVGPYKQLICSEKLQHELQALSLGSCRVDSILAGSILGLVKEIAVGGKNEK